MMYQKDKLKVHIISLLKKDFHGLNEYWVVKSEKRTLTVLFFSVFSFLLQIIRPNEYLV